jgi:hypothetical protein
MASTQEDYVKVLDTLAIKSAWGVAMASVGLAETTAFTWLAASRAAMKRDDKTSPFYIWWREQNGYFHQHAINARIEHKMSAEAIIRAEIRDGLEVKLFDGSGNPIWMQDPLAVALNLPDQDAADLAGFPDYPFLHDEKGARIQATKRELLPATTRNLLLQTLPDYRQHSTVDVKVSSDHVHVHRVLDRPADAQPSGDSELVKDLKRKLLEGPKNPKPDSPVQILGRSSGEMVNGRVYRDEPERVNKPSDETPKPQTLADHPRAYQVPRATPPKGPPEDYGRPAASLDQSSRGRGTPPSGGFRVS